MTKTEEYIICALTGETVANAAGGYAADSLSYNSTGYLVMVTWCGRTPEPGEFTFMDATHALLNAKLKGRLLLCEKCGEAIKSMVEKSVHGHQKTNS